MGYSPWGSQRVEHALATKLSKKSTQLSDFHSLTRGSSSFLYILVLSWGSTTADIFVCRMGREGGLVSMVTVPLLM